MDGRKRPKETTLGVNVFTAPGKAMVGERPRPFGEALGFDPITSTLIFGEHDAVLVDAMMTVAEASATHRISLSKSCLPKICQKSGQNHPDAREMFRAFFVAAGAKRKASPYNMPVYPGALRIAVIRWSPASVQ